MSSSNQQKMNGLSAVERLKATDKYLAEMREILASMDEISALRAKRGEAPSDTLCGYKRSSVEKFVAELEKQRESILSELARAEKKNAELSSQERSQTNALAAAQKDESGKAISELTKKVDSLAISSQDNAVTSFRKGDASLAIESMYTGLSMDIEKMRDDILQEMKYTYKQDMAIYDDLSEKIESLRQTDAGSIEESLKPIGEGITALDEKLNALAPVDYDLIADRVASKVVAGGIDYDALAQHIVSIMTGGAVGAAAASANQSNAELSAMERKIDDIKNTLNGAISVRQMPEFRKLDALIAEYLRSFSYELIGDILVAANAAKDLANRYIVSGNVLRGETMLTDLRLRLARVNVWGSEAITAVTDAIALHNLPVTYAKDLLDALKEACAAFEQSPALPPEDLAQKLLRAKKAFFSDTDMETLDRDTFAEILEIREELGEEEPDQGKILNLTELKKELMSFNLSYFVDLSPAVYAPQPAENTASVDTQTILDAIARLGNTAAEVSAAKESEKEEADKMQEKLAKIARNSSGSVKKPKVLRPAVSARDNKVEKTDQPLRIVKRSLSKEDTNPDSLSKKLVDELAVKIASSRVR